jgi:hypothetical protein
MYFKRESQLMIVDVSTVLNCSAAKAWDEVLKSSLLVHVIRPLARVVPVGGPFPERWSEGCTVQCKSFVFGVIPIGVRTLRFEKVDQKNYQIQIREHDPLIARWDHLVSIKPLDDNILIYRDTIEIDAGRLSLVVGAWANWFYRHRQRRWRALASTL